MPRKSGRGPGELRPVEFVRHFTGSAEGSVLARCGRTTVLCTASVLESVPPFKLGTQSGWVTAEYAMLPGSTSPRKIREGAKGPRDGRSVEIQRMVGRVMRSIAKLDLLGERTIWLDCDVLEADGGTRTTAINGCYVALVDALRVLERRLKLPGWWPLRSGVAAVSVGLVGGEPLLDLEYQEDSRAEADINVVLSHTGDFVELQATGEKRPISREEMDELMDLARAGVGRVVELQRAALDPQGGKPKG